MDIGFLGNNPTLNTIRKQMLSGQKPAQCQRCFTEEYSGIQSHRKTCQKHYPILDEALKNTSIDGSTKHKIQYIDLRLENLCNLRCRMCNPYTSRKLVKEHLKIGNITQEIAKNLTKSRNHENLWAFLDKQLNHVDLIYIAGGEPTLITEHFILLTKCIENDLAKNISLKYSINMTNISSHFFDYWKEFKQVRLFCSIDGFEKVNEYIRNPSDWNTIDKNLQKIEKYIDKYQNIYSEVNTTVQIYNITHLTDLFEYLKQYKNIIKFPFLNILYDPKYFSIKVLPKNIKA